MIEASDDHVAYVVQTDEGLVDFTRQEKAPVLVSGTQYAWLTQSQLEQFANGAYTIEELENDLGDLALKFSNPVSQVNFNRVEEG